jgi:hypothetical protein
MLKSCLNCKTNITLSPIHEIESLIEVKLLIYDVDVSDWVATPLETFSIKTCLESNTRRIYDINNVGQASINFLWINSQISFITNNLNKAEQRLIDAQLNFNLLDKSMRYLEEPFESIFRNIKPETFDHNTQAPDTGLHIIENNEFDMTERLEGMISKVTGKIK